MAFHCPPAAVEPVESALDLLTRAASAVEENSSKTNKLTNFNAEMKTVKGETRRWNGHRTGSASTQSPEHSPPTQLVLSSHRVSPPHHHARPLAPRSPPPYRTEPHYNNIPPSYQLFQMYQHQTPPVLRTSPPPYRDDEKAQLKDMVSRSNRRRRCSERQDIYQSVAPSRKTSETKSASTQTVPMIPASYIEAFPPPYTLPFSAAVCCAHCTGAAHIVPIYPMPVRPSMLASPPSNPAIQHPAARQEVTMLLTGGILQPGQAPHLPYQAITRGPSEHNNVLTLDNRSGLDCVTQAGVNGHLKLDSVGHPIMGPVVSASPTITPPRAVPVLDSPPAERLITQPVSPQLPSQPSSTSPVRRLKNRSSSSDFDSEVDEHFRKSLGQDYYRLVSASDDKEDDAGAPELVDDHFAKALGETWSRIKMKVEPPSPISPLSPQTPAPQSIQLST